LRSGAVNVAEEHFRRCQAAKRLVRLLDHQQAARLDREGGLPVGI
jgi:hypothetical protein